MKRHADSAIRQKKDGVCPACGEPVIHFSAFDAIACMACDTWLEPVCGNPACPRCYGRPATPGKAQKNSWFCKFCGTEAEMCSEYDAMFCPVCDIWLEQRCGDPFCEFCADRPSRPSRVKEWTDGQDIRLPRRRKRSGPMAHMADAYNRWMQSAPGDCRRGGADPDKRGR